MVFISENAILVGLLIFLVAALIFVEGRRGGKAISYHELTQMLNRDAAVAVDVREKKDFQAGHIAGAINIPFAKLKDSLGQLDKHKSKTIVVVDKMGQQTSASIVTLVAAGFDARRMRGGMSDWLGNNLPVVKS